MITEEPDAIYIGQGHFSHRWKPGKWSSPFQAGRDCAGAVHVIMYAQWIANQPELLQSLHELQGKRLVCDCPHNVLCHGDVLVCLSWHSSALLSAGEGHQRQPPSLSARTVAMFAAGARVVSAVPTPITQECAVAAFTSLCRGVEFAAFQWPMIEDLLLDKDILWFTAASHRGYRCAREQGPLEAGIEPEMNRFQGLTLRQFFGAGHARFWPYISGNLRPKTSTSHTPLQNVARKSPLHGNPRNVKIRKNRRLFFLS